MCSCGRVPLLTNRHKQTKDSSENCQSVPLFTGLLNTEVFLPVPRPTSVRFAFGVRRVHRTDSAALGTERRPLFTLNVSYCPCRKRCRDRRARPCVANSYQWQLPLGFYTQPPRSLSSTKSRFAPATKQETRIYHLIATTPTTTPTTIHQEQQKLISLVAAGVCGGVVVSVCHVGCELRVTQCLRSMIV